MTAKHGFALGQGANPKRHPLYNRWVALRQKCRNPRHPRFKDYGGRQTPACPNGIWFDSRWDDFALFLEDIGQPPRSDYQNYSLDRINNDGPYTPDNVRWSTASQQRRNQYRAPWPFGVLDKDKDGAMPEDWTEEDDKAYWERWNREHPTPTIEDLESWAAG